MKSPPPAHLDPSTSSRRRTGDDDDDARSGAGADVARCRVCGSSDCVDLGPPAYRPPPQVAGVPIDVGDLALTHQLCRSCGYRFVHPIIPEERLLACYRRAPQSHWGTDVSHAPLRFYPRKRQLLEQFAPGRRILDFGCYDGGFLEYLGDAWDRAGIEPSESAARVAQQRGVNVLGPTIESLALGSSFAPFDAVVVFDVIEHLNDPVRTLTALAAVMKGGGVMLIETADSDSSHFRRVGKLYPYCALVEHVGFFNRTSVAEAGRRAGMELAHFEPSVHSTYLQSGRATAWAFAAGYWTLRAARGVGLPLSRRLREVAAGPVPRTLQPRDHLLAVLRKTARQ